MKKVCNKCGELKDTLDFAKSKSRKDGRTADCLVCRRKISKEYRELNKSKEAERFRRWRECNLDYDLNRKKEYDKDNKSSRNLRDHRRRARKAALPDNWNHSQQEEMWRYFGNACALTESTENLTLEHAIPIAIGHGGTVHGNMYPMDASLNTSKSSRNIFEWFEANRQRFNLPQERFDRLIEWLGKANGMTVEEYRDYVYWCHDNPRNIGEDEAI